MTVNSKPAGESFPHNLDAERSVLGAILLDNHCLPVALERLEPEDFFTSLHVHIFSAMVALHEKQIPIDVVTLMEELEHTKDLEAAGGIGYLSQLADDLPRITNVEHYARIVKDKSILRALVYTATAIGNQALAADETSDDILLRAKELLNKLAEQQPKKGPVSIQEIVKANYERLENIASGTEFVVTGLPTGYSQLDAELGGLQPSDLIIIAARPSLGKTSLALNIVENVILRKKQPTLMFSLEMSREALLIRLLAARARIDAHKFRTGHLSQDDLVRMVQALSVIGESKFWIDDSSSASIAEIAARSERIKREHGLSLIVIDYLQLVAPGKKRMGSRQEEVSYIASGLKALAKDLGVPVIALSQLTRTPEREERRPMLSDLRESGAIEQTADVVTFIHRPNFYKQDLSEVDRAKAEIIIAKQRNGPVGMVQFVFLERYTRFEEAVPDSWEAGLGGSN